MTNQNKDYSWQWLDDILLGIFETNNAFGVPQAKTAIQSHIDEHYIGKGEAEHLDDTLYKALEGILPANRIADIASDIWKWHEAEVERRCIEARVDELRQIRKWRGTIFHNDMMDYCGDRIEQLSTNNKDTLERSSDERN